MEASRGTRTAWPVLIASLLGLDACAQTADASDDGRRAQPDAGSFNQAGNNGSAGAMNADGEVSGGTSSGGGAGSDQTGGAADTGIGGASAAGGGTAVWRTADLTWYTSYPDPGSEECIEYNGCTWAGYFAALSEKQPESWVMANNIAAVHSKDFEQYKLKTLRLRQGEKQIDVKVYDMCADSDCSGCCTANSASTGFLIDIEKYTAERFGTKSGIVEWTCLDC